MSITINKEVLDYALNCCCSANNPYIFEDISEQKEMYIGIAVKKRPKVGKTYSFSGISIYTPSINHLADIVLKTPIEEVTQIFSKGYSGHIYYARAGNQALIVYIVTKDICSIVFENQSIVHLYVTLSRNVAFNYDYLSRKNMLTLIYVKDIYMLIGKSIVYSPIKNGKIDTSMHIRTPIIKNITPVPYANNIYVVRFNKYTSANNYIILYNACGDLTQTKDTLIKSNSYYCTLCGEYHEDIQWHHIIPRSRGGTDACYNGALLCPQCHKFIHLCQKEFPNSFKLFTHRIIHNKARIKLVYYQIKNKVPKISF